jgi:hypothetical protein
MILRLLSCLLFQRLLYNIPRWENCQYTHQALERVHRAARVLLENWRLDLLISRFVVVYGPTKLMWLSAV